MNFRFFRVIALIGAVSFCLPQGVAAQTAAVVRAYNLSSGESRDLGSLPAGRLWFDREQKTLFLYTAQQIKSYDVHESRLSEKSSRSFTGEEGKDGAPKQLKRYWRIKLPDDNLCFAGGSDGRSLYVGDLKGNVYFFDMKGRYNWGRLNFLRKRLHIIKPLSDESLLLYYEGGDVVFVKRYRAPWLSSLQRLKDSYTVAGRTKIPFDTCQSIEVSPSGEKASFLCNRKNIAVLDIPTMTVQTVLKEKPYIHFVSFLGDRYLLYSSEKQYDMTETPFSTSFRPDMAPFFDWRNSITAPNRGDHFVMISGTNSLRLYDSDRMAAEGEFVDTAQNTGDIFFGEDGDTVFVLNAAKDRLSVYKP